MNDLESLGETMERARNKGRNQLRARDHLFELDLVETNERVAERLQRYLPHVCQLCISSLNLGCELHQNPLTMPGASWEVRRVEAVYYAEIARGRIKIGYSGAPRSRVKSFYGIWMGAEPGGYQREQEVHKRWSHLRVGEVEVFRRNEQLLSYIRALPEWKGNQ